MTPKQRIDCLLEGRRPDRIPFVPAVYEHKASLIGKTPSEVARNTDLFAKAVLKEYEIYQPDLLTIGIDVYDIEAEAIGCEVQYFDDSCDIPAIKRHILAEGAELGDLRIPNPFEDGRMPVMLEVGGRIARELRDEIYVRGAMSGPFSVACGLMGTERLLTMCIEQPEDAKAVLQFCTEVVKQYALAFLENGLQVIVFDSNGAPPLVSPGMYHELVLPSVQELLECLKRSHVRLIPYIVGGDTTSILNSLLETGANNLLADYSVNLRRFVEAVTPRGILLRGNVDPALVASGTREAIGDAARTLLNQGREYPRFIMGTGVIPYTTAPENVLAVKEVILENILRQSA